MKSIFILIFALITISCTSDKETVIIVNENSQSQILQTEKENISLVKKKCQKIDSLITKIDSLKYADYSSINDSLIFNYNDEIAHLCLPCAEEVLNGDSFLADNFNISIANDSLFGIISWNTQLGGSMINFEHVKFWQTQNGIQSFNSYLDQESSEYSFNDAFYNTIHSVTLSSNKTVYLCQSQGQGSSCLPWYMIEAIVIKNNLFQRTNIFPEGKSMMSKFYDLCEYGDFEKVLNFEVDGQIIKVPSQIGNSNPFYKLLEFKSDQYHYAANYKAFIPPGYIILSKKEINLYNHKNNKLKDIVMILRDTLELNQDMWDLPRPLLVLKATETGYDLVERNDVVVMCQDCGGVHGDAFDYLKVKQGEIEIANFGGSSDKWYVRYYFNLNPNQQWMLSKKVEGYYSVFDQDEDGELDDFHEVTTTPIDFGEISLSELTEK